MDPYRSVVGPPLAGTQKNHRTIQRHRYARRPARDFLPGADPGKRIFLDAHRPWHKVKLTERRTGTDFAACMREFRDVHFPEAGKIRLVLDNLSTHTPAALCNALPAGEARRILRRIDFDDTPKHASWFNMVGIEMGVLQQQCLSRRIPDRDMLEAEISARDQNRNDSNAQINWMFTTEKARDKMAKAYPKPNGPETE